MKTVSINLYSFNELNEQAKDKAIIEHCDFLDSLPEDYEDENGVIQNAHIEHSKEDTIASIEANDYLFFYDGQITHCTQYTGKHEKTGITEFHFHGQTFVLDGTSQKVISDKINPAKEFVKANPEIFGKDDSNPYFQG